MQLMINAYRHLDARFGGLHRRPISWVAELLSRPGKGTAAAATRRKFGQGVGNEHLDQIVGRSAALC